ncbi:hypothetical protein P7K49_037854 [Saguinus oedipus]|uniref:Uncharacterized protein n=1 Tax=Saguinus oedipus TaxID=9490 RepID=A0ABQ9TJB9_SAGOE|nr:hypothetical protein P7K49_037854 [Saguinus oedipus]
MRWQCGTRFRGLRPAAAPWTALLALGLPGWVLAVSATAAAVGPEQHASVAGQHSLDWLLTDRGPFHRAQEYADFMERYRQGFTTRWNKPGTYSWLPDQHFKTRVLLHVLTLSDPASPRAPTELEGTNAQRLSPSGEFSSGQRGSHLAPGLQL